MNTPLQATPGWGVPTGVHGEIRVPAGSTDAEVQAIIKARVMAAKYSAGFGVIDFKRGNTTAGQQAITFEVN